MTIPEAESGRLVVQIERRVDASIGEIFVALSVMIAAVLPAVVRAIRVNPLRALKEL